MNKVFLFGKVRNVPDIRTVGNGLDLLELPVTTTREWNGERKEETIPVTFWADRAQEVIQNVEPGSSVIIEGRVSARPWETQDGKSGINVSVNGSRFQVVDSGSGPPKMNAPGSNRQAYEDVVGAREETQHYHPSSPAVQSSAAVDDEELPF